MNAPAAGAGGEPRGEAAGSGTGEVFIEGALGFLLELARRFGPGPAALLTAPAQRPERLRAGAWLDFLAPAVFEAVAVAGGLIEFVTRPAYEHLD